MGRIAFITTTISMPLMLEQYCQNAAFYRHRAVEFFVIGDRKTPTEAGALCQRLTSMYGYPIHYLGIEAQEQALDRYPALLEIIPYDNACRKLLGMVIAYLQGFDILITVDDDNFVTNHDFFGGHGFVGNDTELMLVESPTGWFNACEYLVEEHNIPFYYRGIPWSQRKAGKALVTQHRAKAKVVVNSGFWMGDPDIDATSRLFWPIRVTAMRGDVDPNFGLYPGTWCPFNNQNTAMAREILPAYFTPPSAKRFSDIWPAYVVCRIAQHLGHVVAYGQPFVRQIRNPHDLWQDLSDEMAGAQATEPLIDLLRSAPLEGSSYHECLGELNAHFDCERATLDSLVADQREMLLDFFGCLKVWHGVFESIHRRTDEEVGCP